MAEATIYLIERKYNIFSFVFFFENFEVLTFPAVASSSCYFCF